MEILKAAVFTYLSIVLMYALYLSYCTVMVMKATGRFQAMPRIVQAHCYAILYFTFFLDVALNVALASFVFFELPELKNLTFTLRCAKWKEDRGYRGSIARWVCNGWLNPAEPGHC